MEREGWKLVLEVKDWGKVIRRAIRGGFTLEEIEAAQYWPTCAVSEVNDRDVPPFDSRLYILGVAFAKAVREQQADQAEYLYFDIQDEGERIAKEKEEDTNGA